MYALEPFSEICRAEVPGVTVNREAAVTMSLFFRMYPPPLTDFLFPVLTVFQMMKMNQMFTFASGLQQSERTAELPG